MSCREHVPQKRAAVPIHCAYTRWEWAASTNASPDCVSDNILHTPTKLDVLLTKHSAPAPHSSFIDWLLDARQI